MIAVKTKDPATPKTKAPRTLFDILIPIRNNRIAGIAAANDACPLIMGGKRCTASEIFGTKIGLKMLADMTASMASYFITFFAVGNGSNLNKPF